MITCAKCDHDLPTDTVLDRTPCPHCGSLITAFFTKADGTRISQDEFMSEDTDEPQNTSTPQRMT